jgi:hypothetical protein
MPSTQAGGVDEGAAREAVVHGQVEAHELVDLAAVPAAPARADGRHDAERGGHRRARAAEGEDELADAHRVARDVGGGRRALARRGGGRL